LGAGQGMDLGWKCVKTPDHDVRIAQGLLESLPAHEREALVRFYVDREDSQAVARAVGMRAEKFSELRQWSKEVFLSLRRTQLRPHSRAAFL